MRRCGLRHATYMYVNRTAEGASLLGVHAHSLG